MRDFLLILIIFGSIPFILIRPYYGVLLWTWVSYMNPHRLTWGYASDMPIAMVIGSVTIAAWLFSKESKNISWGSIPAFMLAFALWTNFTTLFALAPEVALRQIIQFDKIILMTFVALAVMRTEHRINSLLLVTVGSIAFFGVKGGLFSLFSGLNYRVWGPPGSMIEENNALAMASVMILPLIFYYSGATAKKWLRGLIWISLFLVLVSVIGSYSRGAFLGLLMIGVFWMFRTRRWYVYIIIIGVTVSASLPFIPGQWIERMETIETYEQDASAMGRLDAWSFAIEMATKRPLVGGGFGVFENSEIYNTLRPNSLGKSRSAHSIYFQILGTQGFVGLLLFLMMLVAGYRATKWMRTQTKGQPALVKEFRLAEMLGLSYIAYGTCGAFLNLATWDLPYTILAVTHLTKIDLIRKLGAETKGVSPQPAAGTLEIRQLVFRPKRMIPIRRI